MHRCLAAVAACLLALPSATAPANPEPSPEELQALVAQLGHDHFIERRKAEDRLRYIGRPAVPLLVRALAESDDAEITFRVQRLLTDVGEDFIVLCSHLSDRNTRVREYAADSLAIRLVGDVAASRNLSSPPVRAPVRFAPEPDERPTPLAGRRPGMTSFVGTIAAFLTRVENSLPVVALPSAHEWRDLAGATITLEQSELVSLQTAFTAIEGQTGLVAHEVRLGGVSAVALTGPASSAETVATERDVALALCRAISHDLAAVRRTAWRTIGLFYAGRGNVMDLMTASASLVGNPHDTLLTEALMLSGHRMRTVFPDIPPERVETVVDALGATRWMPRIAAVRALVTWAPEEPVMRNVPPLDEDELEQMADDEAATVRAEHAELVARAETDHTDAVEAWHTRRQRFHAAVVPDLIDALNSDDPVCAYLGAWAAGALRDDIPTAMQDRFVQGLTRRLDARHPDVTRQALDALAWIKPEPAPAAERALDLGFSRDSDVREAALRYLQAVETPTLYRAVLDRYNADDDRDVRLFLARLLAGARDTPTLTAVIDLLATEPDDSVANELLAVFDETVTDPELWPLLEPMLTADDRSLRHRAKRAVITSGLPGRVERIRTLLDGVEARERIVELQIVLFRLGETELLQVLIDEAFRSESEELAFEAAIGIGETMTPDALNVFADAVDADAVITRMAAVHGIDAFGRACAEAGSVELVRQGYQRLVNFARDDADAVRRLCMQARSNYQGANGYRARAEQARSAAARTASGDRGTWPELPERPARLLDAE